MRDPHGDGRVGRGEGGAVVAGRADVRGSRGGEAGCPGAPRRLQRAPACHLERVLEHPVGCRIPRSYRSPSDGKSPFRGSEGLPAGLSGREKVRKPVP